MESEFEYYAFISYSRKDKRKAKWLQNKLESYKFPKKILKENPNLPKHIRPIFRDTTDLKAGKLQERLHEELEKSEYLIVLCSPNSAQSIWVGKEIDYFIQLERKESIIPLIIKGKPHSVSSDKECFHPVTREKLKELSWLDIHENGKEHEFIKVVATLFSLSFDSLWQRHRRRLIRQRIYHIFLILFFFSILVRIWYINQPFDMTIQPTDNYLENLPFPESGVCINITLNNQTLSQTLYSVDKAAIFRNIPAKYKNTKIKFQLSGAGYQKNDTLIELKDNITLPLTRDEVYFGLLRGIVRKTETDSLIPHAKVRVRNIITITDHQGQFEIFIPIGSQHPTYEALVEWQGKQTRHASLYPLQNNPLLINTLYIP